MWWLLLGIAWSGAPFQACAVASDGRIGFLSPVEGRLFVWDGGAVRELAALPREALHPHHFLAAAPNGGWLAGGHSVLHVADDGTLTVEPDPQPAVLWQSLAARLAASTAGDGVIRVEYPATGNRVVWFDDGGSQELWAGQPGDRGVLSIARQDDRVVTVHSREILLRDLSGVTLETWEFPPGEFPMAGFPYGVCAGAKGPFHVVTSHRYGTCLYAREAGAWREVACVPANQGPPTP